MDQNQPYSSPNLSVFPRYSRRSKQALHTVSPTAINPYHEDAAQDGHVLHKMNGLFSVNLRWIIPKGVYNESDWYPVQKDQNGPKAGPVANQDQGAAKEKAKNRDRKQ